MADVITKLADLIDPEVMADMISAKIPAKIRVAPFAKVDTTLVGQPGSTVTIPSYCLLYTSLCAGVEIPLRQLFAGI